MKKVIKSYLECGDHCGIAKQVQGQIVDDEKKSDGNWHFIANGEKWIASDYAFKE